MSDDPRQRWSELRRRMAQAEQHLNLASTPRPASTQPRAAAASPARAEITLFSRGDQRYALTSRRVLRIIRLERLLRIPTAPPSLLGATFDQGELLPVFDLHLFWRRPSVGVRDLPWAVILGQGDLRLALACEDVDADTRTPEPEPHHLEPVSRDQERAFVLGRLYNETLWLDADAILEDPAFDLHDTTAASARLMNETPDG